MAVPVPPVILLLNVVQSVDERAPVVVDDAVPRDSCWLARERPLAVPRVMSPVLVPWIDPLPVMVRVLDPNTGAVVDIRKVPTKSNV